MKVQAFQINITDSKAVAEQAAAVKAAFGKIDYLFNNAGYQGQFTKAETYDPEDFKKVLDINVNGLRDRLCSARPKIKARAVRNPAKVELFENLQSERVECLELSTRLKRLRLAVSRVLEEWSNPGYSTIGIVLFKVQLLIRIFSCFLIAVIIALSACAPGLDPSVRPRNRSAGPEVCSTCSRPWRTSWPRTAAAPS